MLHSITRLSHDELIEQVLADVRRVVPAADAPVSARVIVEKRATFASTAGLLRPDNRTADKAVFLAGDWVIPHYPATLEGAVRSGTQAASLAMQLLQAGR